MNLVDQCVSCVSDDNLVRPSLRCKRQFNRTIGPASPYEAVGFFECRRRQTFTKGEGWPVRNPTNGVLMKKAASNA